MEVDLHQDFCDVLEDSTCAENYLDDYTPTTPVPKKRKKPSVVAPCTYDDINCLILSIEEHPCVWQYSCSEYKDRYKREQAWYQIQEKCCGHTIDDCKSKWGNLKTAFQNMKKLKTKSGQGANNTKPHWPHWNSMQFCNSNDVAKTTGSISTIDVENEQPEQEVKSGNIKMKNVSFCGEDKHDELLQRAAKCLEEEEDNWHTIAMYLASQMRELAKTNKKAANNLHVQLVKATMEAVLEAE